MNLNWLGKSFVAMAMLIPAWLAISFFNRNFHVKSDVFIVWYFLGIIVSSVISNRTVLGSYFPSWGIVIAISLIGVLIGGVSNLLLFRAVAEAPNPGLPVAISNVASIGVFLATIILCRLLPNYFGAIKADTWSLIGIALTVIGVSIISIRR